MFPSIPIVSSNLEHKGSRFLSVDEQGEQFKHTGASILLCGFL